MAGIGLFKNGEISSAGKQIILAIILFFLGSELVLEIYNPEQYNLKLSPPIDFYQYWGIGLGPKMSGGELKSPYTDLSKYTAFLDARAAQFKDSRMLAASEAGHKYFPHGIDPTGTPLQYAAFAFMPWDYPFSYGIFLATQAMLFVGALVLLYSYKKQKWPLFTLLSMFLIACYAPLRNNLADGNMAATQLFVIVALVATYEKTRKTISGAFRFNFCAVFLSALVFLVLLKPNILLVALVLSAALWTRCEKKIFISSMATAGCIGAGLIILTSNYFGSRNVWGDWYRYFPPLDKNFPYLTASGNCSTSLIVSDALNISVYSASALIVFFLVVHGLWVLFDAKPGRERAKKFIETSTMVLLNDPYICVSLAIVVTLAAAPMVWIHYYLLSLFPAFWLITVSSPKRIGEISGIASILIASGMLPYLFGRDDWVPYTVACGWIPLWFGIQMIISDKIRYRETDTKS